jgi:hypothetical protein
MNTNCATPAVPAATPIGKRPLKDLEAAIAQGLSSIAQSLRDRSQVALAMLDIHDGMLYKKDYGTFKSYLLQRWQISRPRGYQMLHFARVILMSTTVDTGGPENERQARLLDGGGKARRPRETDPVVRVMDYIVKAYEKRPPSERRDFVESVQDLLRDLESKLEPKHKAPTAGCS